MTYFHSNLLIWQLNVVLSRLSQVVLFYFLINMSISFLLLIFLLLLCLNSAEKEQRGELRRGQWRGDPGEQALWGRPRRLGSVHSQGLSHWETHPVLVLCHSASSCASSGRGVLERLSLYANPVRWHHTKHKMTHNTSIYHHPCPTSKAFAWCEHIRIY